MSPNSKPYVEYDRLLHGEFRTAREDGICPWCKAAFHPGDKINWNPRVGGTKAHAGCYKTYGCPTPQPEASTTSVAKKSLPYVAYDPEKHGGYQISKFNGVCKWCGLLFHINDKVNWTPKVKGTACHAGCYGEYGPPIPQPQSEPKFIPNPNAPPKPDISPFLEDEPNAPIDGLPKAIVDAIIPYLNGRLQNLVTKEQVEPILDKILGGRTLKTVTTITIERETELGFEVTDLGIQHKMFPDLLDTLKAGLHPWIAGPAGSGKTTAVENVTTALGYGFFMTGAIETEYKLTGFVTADGKIVSTEFRRAVEYAITHPDSGAVFLWDECDRSHYSALLAFNAVLSNGTLNFPDKQIKKPKNLWFCACANTWGTSSTEYVGAMKQDAAFLDRFCPLEWDYDEDLERAMCPNVEWVKRVQEVRARVRAKGIKIIISPRATLQGAALLAGGMLQSKVEARLLRKNMSQEDWNSVKGGN